MLVGQVKMSRSEEKKFLLLSLEFHFLLPGYITPFLVCFSPDLCLRHVMCDGCIPWYCILESELWLTLTFTDRPSSAHDSVQAKKTIISNELNERVILGCVYVWAFHGWPSTGNGEKRHLLLTQTGTKDAEIEKHDDFVLHLLKMTVKGNLNFINTTQDNIP